MVGLTLILIAVVLYVVVVAVRGLLRVLRQPRTTRQDPAWHPRDHEPTGVS